MTEKKTNYIKKGGQDLAHDLIKRITRGDRHFNLYGPHGSGKTSFLLNLKKLFPSDLISVYLNIQNAAVTTSESDFWENLVKAIYKDSRSQGVDLPVPPKRSNFQESPYTVLEDWLDEAIEKLGDKRLLLNLDEFEKIGTAIKQGRITLRLFDELRHLIQHCDQLAFIFSSVKALTEIEPRWCTYFIGVILIEIE